MAKAAKRPQSPSFYEIVMEGSPKMIRGLVSGLLLGSGATGTVFYHQDERIRHESLREKIAEMVRLHPQDCRFVADAGTRDLLSRHGGAIEKETGLRIASSRFIRSASVKFTFEAFARRYGVEILGILKDLPAGLRLTDFQHEEEEHPEAVGVEAYASAHDYQIKGSGRVVGRIDLLIPARRQLDAHPLIKPGPIDLNLA